MHTGLPAALIAVVWLSSAACAQRMPDPRDDRRVVELHDATDWLAKAALSEARGPDGSSDRDRALLAAARFARSFCEPALTADEDVSALAGRYLVAALRPEQQVWVREMIERHAAEGAPRLDVRVKQLQLAAADFDASIAPLLTAHDHDTAQTTAMLDHRQTANVVRTIARLGDRVAAVDQTLQARPLTVRHETFGRTIPYVRDYDVEVGTASFTATPVHDTMFEGLTVDLVAGRLAGDVTGVSLRASLTDVVEPMPQFETELGVDGRKLTVDLPECTARGGEWNARIPKSGAALCVLRSQESVLAFLVRVAPAAQ